MPCLGLGLGGWFVTIESTGKIEFRNPALVLVVAVGS
jgi:hypothetical protein